MKVLLLTQYLPNYADLGAITDARRDAYAAHWRAQGRDYAHRAHVGEYRPELGLPFGFQRIQLIRDILDEPGAPDLVFWTGADCFLLNLTLPVEGFTEGRHYGLYDFFITADCHGLNSDSFIVRNTPWARQWLDFILGRVEEGKQHCWAEQAIMQRYWQAEYVVHKVCPLPQGLLNSYDYGYYKPWDPATMPGQVQKGDLLLHLPGMSKEQRLEIFRSQRVADLMVNPAVADPAIALR